MALENISNTILGLPPEIASRFGNLITIFQAVGGMIIIYIIFSIINTIINRRKNKEIKIIRKNLEEIKQILKKRKK